MSGVLSGRFNNMYLFADKTPFQKIDFATLCTFATLQDRLFQRFKHHSVSQDDGHTKVPRWIAEVWDGHRQSQQAEKVIWDGCLKGGIRL